jgi:hypothetical protein
MAIFTFEHSYPMGTNIRYIVTNMNDFRARGSAELCIKDHKLYLKSKLLKPLHGLKK